MTVEAIVLAAVIGFWWGEWAGASRAKPKSDAGTALLTSMLAQILDKRRFVGPGVSITRSETIEVEGAKFQIQMISEGDPKAVEREAA